MSYQTDFICTYKQMDDEFGQDYLYRAQLLQAFDLEHWNDDKVNSIMEETFSKIKDVILFREIIETAKANKDINDLLKIICLEVELSDETCKDKLVFELLFKYEYFDLTHKCLCEQFRNGRIRDSTHTVLINKLN